MFRGSIGRNSKAVHPHGCGEHEIIIIFSRLDFGSSPRVWGTSQEHLDDHVTMRFIPTGVGNMIFAPRKVQSLSVHPHGCGEHFPSINSPETSVGSSPRVWGTYCKWLHVTDKERFIPTGVGNIEYFNRDNWETAVHPHGCGEHNCNFRVTIAAIGSSPRVWGTF